MDAGTGGRVTRVVAVLALVLGVLAMHAASGGHHGVAPGLSAATPSVAMGHAGDHGTGLVHVIAHDALAAGAAAAAPLHDLAGGCAGDCSAAQQPTGLLLLCVAVLLAAGGALARAPACRAWLTAPATGPSPGGPAPTTTPPRRLDPVADLCTSRT